MTAGGQDSLTDSQAVIAVESCAQTLASRYDDKLGGFGTPPKFPRPSELNLLLVQHLRAKAAGSKAEASKSLLSIACRVAVRVALNVSMQP